MAFKDNVNHYSREIVNSQISINEMEEMSFNGYDGHLNEYEKIIREYITLQSILAFDYDGDYQEYSDTNKLVRKIGEYIDNRSFLDDEIAIESIKEIIVYAQLQVGCKVSFYKTFDEMKKTNLLSFDYSTLKKLNLFNFKSLYQLFYEEQMKKNERNTHNDTFTNEKYIYDNLELISKNIKNKKNSNYEEIFAYLDIIEETKRIIESANSVDDINFCRKVLVYLEYKLSINVRDKEIIEMMTKIGEIKCLEEEKVTTFDELKEIFNYQRMNKRL